jgi:uncharacterized protein (DUF2147 family)
VSGPDFARRIRTAAIAAAILSVALPMGLPAAAGSSPEGVWKLAEGDVQIAITSCGDMLCGHIVTATRIEQNPDITDERNADPALRQRKVKGLRVLSGFEGASPEWKNGKIYNPDDGYTYKGTIRLVDDSTMKITACIQWPLCKPMTLIRASESGKAVAHARAERG